MGLAVHRVDAVQVGLDLHALAGGLIGGGGNGGNGEVTILVVLEFLGLGHIPHDGQLAVGAAHQAVIHHGLDVLVSGLSAIENAEMVGHILLGVLQCAQGKALAGGFGLVLVEHEFLHGIGGSVVLGAGDKAHAGPNAVSVLVGNRCAQPAVFKAVAGGENGVKVEGVARHVLQRSGLTGGGEQVAAGRGRRVNRSV